MSAFEGKADMGRRTPDPFLNAGAGCYDPRQSLGGQLSAVTKSNRWFGRGWMGEIMRIQHTIALALAVGLGLGVIATRGLAAQAKRTFYVVIEVDEITDVDGYKAMTKIGPSNIVEVKHADGRYLARADNLAALDGAAPKSFVMVAFTAWKRRTAFIKTQKR